MSSLNKVTLIGRLGKDPEVRSLNDGSKVVSLNLATSERWRDKQSGETKEKSEWHSVVIFNDRLAEVAERYLRKGSQTYVEGKLQTRKWSDKNGNDRYTTEVVLQRFGGELILLGGKGDAQDGSQQRAPAKAGGGYQTADDLDDDVPFVSAIGREPGTSRRRV